MRFSRFTTSMGSSAWASPSAGRIGEQDGREVGRRLRGGDHGQRVPAKLREQRQCRRDLGDAPVLARPVGPEPVHDRLGRHQVVLRLPCGQIAGMLAQDRVRARVAPGVERDTVDVADRRQQGHDGRGHAVSLDEADVQLDRRGDERIGRQDGEALAVGALGHPHRSQLLRQVDRFAPGGEGRLDAAVGLGILAQQLQARARADAVVGDGQHDALGVGVVRHLVAAPLTELAANVRRGRTVGRQRVGHRPVPGILSGRLRRVVPGPDDGREGPSLLKGLRLPCERPHQTVPPSEILASLTPSPLPCMARLDARCLSAAIWSVRPCCSTDPESPLARRGPAAFVSIALSSVLSLTGLLLHPCLGGVVAVHGRKRLAPPLFFFCGTRLSVPRKRRFFSRADQRPSPGVATPSDSPTHLLPTATFCGVTGRG